MVGCKIRRRYPTLSPIGHYIIVGVFSLGFGIGGCRFYLHNGLDGPEMSLG